MIKYLFVFFIAFFILLSSSILLNYNIDPANIFQDKSYEKGIAEILISGMNAANISNYDERLLQKYVISRINHPPDVIILGSSRCLQIQSRHILNKKLFNHGVSGASIQDYLAIYYQYLKRDLILKTVILAIDPWIFNRGNKQNRWKSLKSDYQGMKMILNSYRRFDFHIPYSILKFQELISWAYLKKSISKISSGENISNCINYYPTDKDISDVPIKRSDGSLYEANYENYETTKVQKLVNEFIEKPYSLDNFSKIDSFSLELFTKFIIHLKNNNIKVIFFLPPYYPEVYKHFINNKRFDLIPYIEQMLREMAKKHEILILGSYDPSQYGCEKTEFYDGMHPTEECITKIFSQMEA